MPDKSEWFERLDARLDRLDSSLTKVDKTLVLQEANLAEHMRRTDLLESDLKSVRAELKPVTTHVAVVAAIVKSVAFLGALAGAVAGIYRAVAG